MADSLGPRLPRRETRVKIMRNRPERAIAIAINTGVVAVGAVRRAGAALGRTDKSIWPLMAFMGLVHVHIPYIGDTVDGVHVTGPLSFRRAQDPVADNEDSIGSDYKYDLPRRPKKTVGPSIFLDDKGSDSCSDDETTRRATRL